MLAVVCTYPHAQQAEAYSHALSNGFPDALAADDLLPIVVYAAAQVRIG